MPHMLGEAAGCIRSAAGEEDHQKDGGEVKYFFRYFCAFCAMHLLWGFARKHKHVSKEVACPLHISGVLLTLLAALTIVPLAAFGLFGFYLSLGK
jgi:hypothetical protein